MPSKMSKGFIAVKEREQKYRGVASILSHVLQGIIALGISFQATPLPSIGRS